MAERPAADVAELTVGQEVSIGERVQIGGIDGPAQSVEIGDNVTIGDDVRIIAPRVKIGDYTVIHNHTTIYGYEPIMIGSCSWIGQNVVLNCTGPLTIGCGATISAYSSIWTHFCGGDPLQGSRYNSKQPAQLGEDVWIGVQATIAPVSIAAKSLVLAGSVVTKDIAENRVFGGNPAVDLTDKLGAPYIERSPAQKYGELCEMLREFQAGRGVDTGAGEAIPDGSFTLGGITVTMADCGDTGTSVFDVRDRTYSKLRTPEEIAFMEHLLPLIKFYPRR